ncbi:MAG: T9SS type A sorting domain-containing protein, partial [Cyclobacteriaceae bacterium]|nr:T9SS type A sorting domain-containing protein [Cyclobacteriaceae bacterium HetDA_MAG_MS6]
QSINDAHKYRGLKAWVDGLTVSSAARDAGEEGSIHIGIGQGLKSTEFKVYPNPTKDGSIKVVANSNVKNGQITVLTIEGKVLQKVQWNGELEEVQLNKTGLYILQLNDGNGLVKKFKVLNN